MKKKSTVGRVLIEILIIFSSVVLAFFFEDYREEQNEISRYTQTLSAFRIELISEIQDRTNEVDSFRIDSKITGRQFERYLLLQGLDSLIYAKKTSKEHYRFIVTSGILNTELFGRYDPSPLADEILAKNSEHIENKRLVTALTSYKENIINVTRGEDEVIEITKELEEIIKETNPHLEFNVKDLKLLTSNRFIWSFHELLQIRQGIYFFNQYLSRQKLLTILDIINSELETFGIPFEKDDCIRKQGFKKRSECYGHLNDDQSITSIIDIASNRSENIGKENR
ncbi:hypothetical protein [Marivirga sp.]|uniref:hypothetical protein n=1 Tax=Marivirga sp. TaxID=2018662 RepID=UPI003DA75903